ncbi:pentapeptide repeat-containing protein [Haloferax sp. Atlit-109R]|nr:hypothetical protein C5B88_14210 [Haloferax sp. Atlit-24N]RLM35942.1 pentapeptide repeat-containing protein [Haloferax sp. Atlit-109R]RLM43792.1 pentapeptide repeat-containing protein [Haloferax sp. Atlit-105R]
MRLPRADFTGLDLSGATFDGALLAGADFSETNLDSATFEDDASLRNAVFTEATCVQTQFQSADLRQALFQDAEIVDTNLWGIKGTEIDFSDSSLEEVRLHQSNLDEAIFTNATLDQVSFNASKLTEATFSKATLLDCDFNEAELSDIRFPNIEIDAKTSFGPQLLLEYEGDRCAEPTHLLSKYEIPRVSDRKFGTRTSPIEPDPPDSVFPRIRWRTHFKFKLCSTPYRIYSRLRAQINLWRAKKQAESGTDVKVPKQLKKLRQAEQTYSVLKTTYRSNSLRQAAREYNVREKEAERKHRFPGLAWVRNSTLKWLMWYGESPKHVLKVGFVAWILSAMILFGLGFQTPSEHIKFSVCGTFRPGVALPVLELSLRRLLTFSSGSVTLTGASESAGVLITGFGKLLEALLIFTLGRRAVA